MKKLLVLLSLVLGSFGFMSQVSVALPSNDVQEKTVSTYAGPKATVSVSHIDTGDVQKLSVSFEGKEEMTAEEKVAYLAAAIKDVVPSGSNFHKLVDAILVALKSNVNSNKFDFSVTSNAVDKGAMPTALVEFSSSDGSKATQNASFNGDQIEVKTTTTEAGKSPVETSMSLPANTVDVIPSKELALSESEVTVLRKDGSTEIIKVVNNPDGTSNVKETTLDKSGNVTSEKSFTGSTVSSSKDVQAAANSAPTSGSGSSSGGNAPESTPDNSEKISK